MGGGGGRRGVTGLRQGGGRAEGGRGGVVQGRRLAEGDGVSALWRPRVGVIG